ncbi:MAG: hypothetical protein PF505_11520 [Vallitaleaceae bacterium]|jgi:hypothetical protein|nr:hypothetical protein [Vallitaleaceae bacterium]
MADNRSNSDANTGTNNGASHAVNNMDEQMKSKGKGGLVVIVVIIVLVGFIALVKMDVFGLGTNVLGPSLQNVPVLNLILPAMPEIVVEEPSINYAFETVEEAIIVIKEKDDLLKEMAKEAENNSVTILALTEENTRLKVFEDNQVKYQEDKAAFDILIAEQADPKEYMDFVEDAYPENALTIYSELVQVQVMNDSIAVNAAMFSSMNPADAAAIFEITQLTDMEMVAQILFSLEATKAGAILAEMDPTTADRISRYMYPTNN